MPVYKHHTVLEIARGIKAFLRLEVGLLRDTGSADAQNRQTNDPMTARDPVDSLKNGVDKQPESVKATVQNVQRQAKIVRQLRNP